MGNFTQYIDKNGNVCRYVPKVILFTDVEGRETYVNVDQIWRLIPGEEENTTLIRSCDGDTVIVRGDLETTSSRINRVCGKRDE